MIERASLEAGRQVLGALIRAAAADTGVSARVHWPTLEAMEAGGTLRLWIAWESGEPRGYALAVLGLELFGAAPSLSVLSIYADPAWRGLVGRGLLLAVLRECELAGAFPRISVPANRPRLERLLERLGFTTESVAWVG